jgi:mono/diheme cytochrome c family protein
MVAGCVVASAASVALLAGCRGDRSDNPPRQFLPDMDDQPRWNPQSESAFFADGRTMRPPVDGTVAFGAWGTLGDEDGLGDKVARRASYLRADRAFYEGLDGGDNPVRTIPASVTRQVLDRGAERFNIFCAVCHGYEGDGKGTVGQHWSYIVPSFHDDRYQVGGELGQDGHLYRVAMWGVRRPDGGLAMPGYAHALSADDGWAVVAYIRALQETRRGSIEDRSIPENVRRNLRQQRTSDSGGASLAPSRSASAEGDPSDRGEGAS